MVVLVLRIIYPFHKGCVSFSHWSRWSVHVIHGLWCHKKRYTVSETFSIWNGVPTTKQGKYNFCIKTCTQTTLAILIFFSLSRLCSPVKFPIAIITRIGHVTGYLVDKLRLIQLENLGCTGWPHCGLTETRRYIVFCVVLLKLRHYFDNPKFLKIIQIGPKCLSPFADKGSWNGYSCCLDNDRGRENYHDNTVPTHYWWTMGSCV